MGGKFVAVTGSTWLPRGLYVALTGRLPRRSRKSFVRPVITTYEIPTSQTISRKSPFNAVVTPLRKAASYEPRIAILGIWGDDTWLTRGKYGIYVAVRGSYGVYATPTAT